ncbi:hypothetical protein SAMN05216223_10955 [Actinacidiphila yanglinensis]|uniref:Secreted protein n=1 Tax=Actinacidiphila yanglinensis TaxID=310779 RepID=A0A1H6CJ45_9ACTN|nr:hypothetical protein [Actinacidiphila yanglinensis]SEG72970.1 hypothetical protein SAMN05216223_10955 [Actinacidiphila yanglinensis]
MKPWLFLDVDGPLNPYAGEAPDLLPRGYALHRLRPAHWPAELPPLPVWLNPGHGGQLAELADLFTLAWATTWEDEANTLIGPLIGLPELPVVHWPELREAPAGGMFWKTESLVRFAGGRPFAWVDDEIGAADDAWVRRHHPARALLRWIDPREGLSAADVATLGEWALTLG